MPSENLALVSCSATLDGTLRGSLLCSPYRDLQAVDEMRQSRVRRSSERGQPALTECVAEDRDPTKQDSGPHLPTDYEPEQQTGEDVGSQPVVVATMRHGG